MNTLLAIQTVLNAGFLIACVWNYLGIRNLEDQIIRMQMARLDYFGRRASDTMPVNVQADAKTSTDA
jgi:hypothetical protein